MKPSGLGRGLSALLPQKNNFLSQNGKSASEVPLEKIRPNPRQPRDFFDEEKIAELSRSVREHGVLQPLVVTEDGNGGYELIAGERRFKAAKVAGLKTVPIIIRSAKDIEKLELALIENLQRENLNPLEEARAYAALMNEFGLTQEAVAERVGKSRPHVGNAVRLLSLPEEIQRALTSGNLNAGSARALLALKTHEEQLALLKKILESGLTVRQVESVSRRRSSARAVKDVWLASAEETLREALGTKVGITARRGRGSIKIEFYSDEEMKELVKKLSKM